jgi:hypothetical protein
LAVLEPQYRCEVPCGPRGAPNEAKIPVFYSFDSGGRSIWVHPGTEMNLARKRRKPRTHLPSPNRPTSQAYPDTPEHSPDTHRTLPGHSRATENFLEPQGSLKRRELARIPSCFPYNLYFIRFCIFKNDSCYICFRGKVVWAKWPKGYGSHRPKSAGAPRAARAQVAKGPRAPRAPRAPLAHAAKGHKCPSQGPSRPQSPRVVIRCA